MGVAWLWAGKPEALGEVGHESAEDIEDVGEYALLEWSEVGVVGAVEATE